MNRSKHQFPSDSFDTPALLNIKADIDVEVLLEPLERTMVKPGLFMEITLGNVVLMKPGSGIAINRGIAVLNTPGIINADYSLEV